MAVSRRRSTLVKRAGGFSFDRRRVCHTMSDEQLYLKPGVAARPLFHRWYVWPQLVYPPTAAMNVAGRYVRIMKSYVKAPALHAAALRNPKMLGGPFIDLPGERSGEIERLLDETGNKLGDLLRLAEAIRELSMTLEQEGKGGSLERLYAGVPEPLKGRVELVYDLNSHPNVRYIEPLFYRAPLYRDDLQALALMEGDASRAPNVFSTPILPGDPALELRLPFAHVGYDALFRVRTAPGSFAAVADELGLDGEGRRALRTLLTAEPPEPFEPYAGDGVRVRYMGHATVLVEAGGVSILADPFLGYGHDAAVPQYSFDDLPERIDYVLITHAHPDHLHLETLLQLRHKAQAIIVPKAGGGALQDPSIKGVLEAFGFKCVRELGELEECEIPSGRIVGIPFMGEHAELDVKSKLVYLVQARGRSLMFAADTRNLAPELYAQIHRLYGDVDALFVGMECDGAPLSWHYGALLTGRLERSDDDARRLFGCDDEMALAFIRTLNCREIYIYAMGMEPWLKYLCSTDFSPGSRPIALSDRVVEECRRAGLKAARLFGRDEFFY
jgi:L-ascorbate metabolism protein UlaG (beta-lactamase superfamily)